MIDATDQVVGRLAAQIAPILMGKHRPTYTPHIDTGDYVIVTNVDKVVFTGNKWRQKSYQRYSGYPGGQREEAAWKLFQRRPERILELAIQRMMPKNKIGRHMMAKLKLYVGPEPPPPGPVPDPARGPLGPPAPAGCPLRARRRSPRLRSQGREGRAAGRVSRRRPRPAAPADAPTSRTITHRAARDRTTSARAPSARAAPAEPEA